MVIIDTDILVGFLRGNSEAIEKIKEIENSNTKLFTTSINSYEVYKGAYLSSNSTKNLFQVMKLLQNITIIDFDSDASQISAKIHVYLKNKGLPIDLMDQMIASIVISKNEILITRNKKHYKNIPNLKLEIW